MLTPTTNKSGAVIVPNTAVANPMPNNAHGRIIVRPPSVERTFDTTQLIVPFSIAAPKNSRRPKSNMKISEGKPPKIMCSSKPTRNSPAANAQMSARTPIFNPKRIAATNTRRKQQYQYEFHRHERFLGYFMFAGDCARLFAVSAIEMCLKTRNFLKKSMV